MAVRYYELHADSHMSCMVTGESTAIALAKSYANSQGIPVDVTACCDDPADNVTVRYEPNSPTTPQITDTEINLYDKEEIHHNCTVQVWTNTETGQTSIGWWPEGEPPVGMKEEE